QPSIRSPMSAGSSWGTLASAAATICCTASSGRMVVSDPLNALPMGDLAVATITASGMAAPSDSLGLLVSSLCERPALANCSPHFMIMEGRPAQERHFHDHVTLYMHTMERITCSRRCRDVRAGSLAGPCAELRRGMPGVG